MISQETANDVATAFVASFWLIMICIVLGLWLWLNPEKKVDDDSTRDY